jgi:hypothetical protein
MITGRWLGYKYPETFDVLLQFNKATRAKEITISSYHVYTGHIMPPTSIEIKFGMDRNKMKTVRVLKPAAPVKKDEDGQAYYDIPLPAEEFRYLQIHAVPTAKVPAWLSGKKEPGWFFVDELMLK